MDTDTSVRTWDDFVNDLNDEFVYPLLREYLMHYLRNFERYSAHYDSAKVKSWLSRLRKSQEIETVVYVCDEMMSEMYDSKEYLLQYDYVYGNSIKFLFGGMYGLNRDYVAEFGFTTEELQFIFIRHTTPFQRFQLQMCYELFWGWKGFGKQDLNTYDDYMGFADDLYTTISCSPYTKYYLAAIKDTRETKPSRIFTTLVNIIVHAYHFVIEQRNDQDKILNPSQQPVAWKNLWCDFIRDECVSGKSDFTSSDIYDLVWLKDCETPFAAKKSEHELISNCLD